MLTDFKITGREFLDLQTESFRRPKSVLRPSGSESVLGRLLQGATYCRIGSSRSQVRFFNDLNIGIVELKWPRVTSDGDSSPMVR